MIFPAVVFKLLAFTFSSVIGVSLADFFGTVRASRTPEPQARASAKAKAPSSNSRGAH